MAKGIVSKALGLLEKNYALAKAIYKRRQVSRMNQHKGPPIVVLQMGKVGSKTVRLSLEKLKLDMPVYHSHLMTWDRIAETEAKRKKHFRTDREPYLKRPWKNEFLREQFDKASRKWKFITLTREPIGRNLSTFFENLQVVRLDEERYEIRSDYYDIDEPIVVTVDDTDKLTELFMDRINHDSPLTFFEREVKGVVGIDVYAREFPRDKGYEIYDGEKAQLLLIRLESLNDCHKAALKEFLGIDDFTLTDTNVGDEKEYAALYKKLKEAICLPESYLEKFYTSDYCRHFYSGEEIEKFRAKWERKRVS